MKRKTEYIIEQLKLMGVIHGRNGEDLHKMDYEDIKRLLAVKRIVADL